MHRDLRPSNVLIDSADQPRLAKRLENEIDLTLSGQVLGSPNFMPPEQATAQRCEDRYPPEQFTNLVAA